MAEEGRKCIAKGVVIVIDGGCTILCLPDALALVWTLHRQEKWVCERVALQLVTIKLILFCNTNLTEISIVYT